MKDKTKKPTNVDTFIDIFKAAKRLNIPYKELIIQCRKKEIKSARKINNRWCILDSEITLMEITNKTKKDKRNIRLILPIKSIFKKFISSLTTKNYAIYTLIISLITLIFVITGPIEGLSLNANKLEIINRISPAMENETLIIIAKFDYPNEKYYTPAHKEIAKSIDQSIKELELQNIRVETLNITFPTDEENFKKARKYAEDKNASIIIWGEDTGIRVTVEFLNLRNECCSIEYDEITETHRTQMADPSGFNTFITDDLPRQLSFLSLYTIAQTYIIDRDYKNAMHTLENALLTLPKNNLQISLNGIANTYYLLGWLHYIYGDDRYVILDYLDKALSIEPNNAKVLSFRGWMRYLNDDFENAKKDYDLAIHLSPNLQDAYVNRGIYWSDQENNNKAIADYTSALYIQSSDYIFQLRAYAYEDNDAVNLAIRDAKSAISLAPENANWYALMSSLLIGTKEYSKALEYINIALDLSPDQINYYNDRGFIQKNLGKIDKAISDFTYILTINPTYTSALLNRAIAYEAKGYYQDAINDYDTIYLINPEKFTYYYNRANVKLLNGNFSSAIEDLTIHINSHPDSFHAYYLRSQAYEKNNQPIEAEMDLKKYEELIHTAVDNS
jgi:tetratricopeptide (TPR) repeat protein